MPEKDRSSWGFREMFENRYLKNGHPWPDQATVHYIRDANHIYQEISSQEELLGRISRFCDTLSPAGQAVSSPARAMS
jgi:hypothetical protein